MLSEVAGDGGAGAGVAGLVAAAAAAGAWAALRRVTGSVLRAAAVTAVFLLAAVPMALWVSTLDDVGVKAAASLYLLFTASAWLLAFSLGPTRGRPVFLAGALAAAWLLLSVLVVDTGGPAAGPFGSARSGVAAEVDVTSAQSAADDDGDGIPNEFDPDSGESDPVGPDREPLSQLTDDDESFDPASVFPFLFGFGLSLAAVGVVSLLLGLGYLALAWLLDRAGFDGSATPFQAVGVVALVVGTSVLSAEVGDGGAVLSLAAGVLLLWLGTGSGRRLTAWLGVALVVGGAVGVVEAVVDDDVASSVLLLFLGAAALVAASVLLPGDDPEDEAPVLPPASPDESGGSILVG